MAMTLNLRADRELWKYIIALSLCQQLSSFLFYPITTMYGPNNYIVKTRSYTRNCLSPRHQRIIKAIERRLN